MRSISRSQWSVITTCSSRSGMESSPRWPAVNHASRSAASKLDATLVEEGALNESVRRLVSAGDRLWAVTAGEQGLPFSGRFNDGVPDREGTWSWMSSIEWISAHPIWRFG